MKKDKIIYWATTGLVGFMMLFSAYNYFTNPQMAAAFKHLGFPDFFRVELALAKILGVAVLLTPQVSTRIKEWAYAGFGIVFISAAVAHGSSGDATALIITPIVFLGILIVSNIYLHKVSKLKIVSSKITNTKAQSSVQKNKTPEFSQSY